MKIISCLKPTGFWLLAYVIFGVLLPARGLCADWWSMPDADFVEQYKNLALGNQKEQSQFAWMLFARLNQPESLNGTKFSTWELWPSNPDTFSPNVNRFLLANKIRTRPHLQPPKTFRLNGTAVHGLFNPSLSAGEEVTRNMISYNYIMDPARPLNTALGVAAAIRSTTRVDLPVAATETKGDWVAKQGIMTGMYQIGSGTNTFGLAGLHIMVKIVPTPKNPQSSPDPSWFWTTFEFKDNPDRAAALKFITPSNVDALPLAAAMQLLATAGLSETSWVNYRCNGAQISFVNGDKKPIVLGNTTMEAYFATPPGPPASNWKSWTSSCHTCHGESSAQPTGTDGYTLPFGGSFNPEVGPIIGIPPGFVSLDFNWSIAFHAQ